MLPFRTEIRNSPNIQTIKVYLSNVELDKPVKEFLEKNNDIDFVEIQDSVARDRVEENITIFRKSGVNINQLKEKVDTQLSDYFH